MPSKTHKLKRKIIQISKGAPDHEKIKIKSRELVTFLNNDAVTYLIEFQRRENSNHDPICLVLPALDSLTIEGDPNDQNATCVYKVLKLNGQMASRKPGVEGGGGHSIIIGSGSIDNKR
jgi:hypothetical protein